MAKRKKGMTFIPYDYEAAYNKSLEDMHEFFIEQMFKQGKKVVYALKEIRAGDQFEVEIYPQFKKMDEVPPEGRSIKKDNDKAQRNLNDKNARKYVERLINENFTDRDLWLTFTYDNEHLPPDGDIDAAIKNVQKFIRRVNYQRKKRGLPNARYVYVTAYNPTEEIRWHHHIVMDGDMDMDGKWFGITYAFITHSRYESKPFDQKMTPYTEDGRRRYVNYRTKHKPLPCDRPSINTPEDIALSIYASGKGWRANFEYFMNREYAYNRDKGKCKCCGRYFSELIPKHCHHVNPRLPIERINKVPNLAWLCIPCHRMVHNSPIPPELDAKAVRKIKKYREKLKK